MLTMTIPQKLMTCALVLLPSIAFTDSWITASITGVMSPNAERLVRVVPGDSWGNTYGFKGAKVGDYARAIFYELNNADSFVRSHEFTLLNPVSPVDIYLTDEGRLVTLDNWHNMGYGQVVVVFDIKGIPTASYTLVELYEDENDIGSLPASVSSIWWRCGEAKFFGSKFIIHEANGGQFEFQIETGEFTYQPGELDC